MTTPVSTDVAARGLWAGLRRKVGTTVSPFLGRIADVMVRKSARLPGLVEAYCEPVLRRLAAGTAPPWTGASVLGVPEIAAKVVAYESKAPSYVIRRVRREGGYVPGQLAVPPVDLWEGYGATPDEYLHQGRSHTALMRNIMATSGFPLESCRRIMDLGCASGRMIRFLEDLALHGEVWGVDINEAHIHWCQQYMSPPFLFASTSTFPHLPFEDRYFDFIYAGSVFTHVAELADAWILELRRVLRPGGRLFLSVHDRHCVKRLFELAPDAWFSQLVRDFDQKTHFLDSDFAVAAVSRSPYAQVFYDIEYLQERWGRFMKVISVHEEGYGIHTVIQLEK